jgi:hypothetical protein
VICFGGGFFSCGKVSVTTANEVIIDATSVISKQIGGQVFVTAMQQLVIQKGEKTHNLLKIKLQLILTFQIATGDLKPKAPGRFWYQCKKKMEVICAADVCERKQTGVTTNFRKTVEISDLASLLGSDEDIIEINKQEFLQQIMPTLTQIKVYI